MKKTIFLLASFLMFIVSVVHAQSTINTAKPENSKNKKQLEKSSTPVPGHVDVEVTNGFTPVFSGQNIDPNSEGAMYLFNDLGEFVLIGTTGSSFSSSIFGASTSYLLTGSQPLAFGTDFVENMRIIPNGNVGIGTDTPDELLDVNGKIAITADVGDEMVIMNSDTWNHFNGSQVFNNGGDNWMVASKEGSGESAGIYGDGDCVTIWSPGDGVSGAPFAFLAVCDEDNFDATDTDPYNNGGLIYYLTETGGWIASDRNRKENVYPFSKALDKITQLDVFTYNYKRTPAEVNKGQASPEVVGIIAQDLHEVVPQAVNVTPEGEYFINYNQVTPVLIGAIKELKTENNELKQRLATLEAAVQALSKE